MITLATREAEGGTCSWFVSDTERVKHAGLADRGCVACFTRSGHFLGTFYRFRFAPPVANEMTPATQAPELLDSFLCVPEVGMGFQRSICRVEAVVRFMHPRDQAASIAVGFSQRLSSQLENGL